MYKFIAKLVLQNSFWQSSGLDEVSRTCCQWYSRASRLCWVEVYVRKYNNDADRRDSTMMQPKLRQQRAREEQWHSDGNSSKIVHEAFQNQFVWRERIRSTSSHRRRRRSLPFPSISLVNIAGIYFECTQRSDEVSAALPRIPRQFGSRSRSGCTQVVHIFATDTARTALDRDGEPSDGPAPPWETGVAISISRFHVIVLIHRLRNSCFL